MFVQRGFAAIALLAILGQSNLHASTQTAAFTYQGVLRNNNTPINGSVDLQFRLFDAAVGGNQVGSTIAVNAVAVDSGLFTETLDFGTLVFNGDERWLEIAVASPAGGGAGPFTTLSPRQRITSAPYAVYALNASISGTQGGAVDFTNAANTFTGAFSGSGAGLTNISAAALTGTIPSGALGGTYANQVEFTNALNVLAGKGASITDLNASNISTGTLNTAHLPTGGNWALSSNLTIDTDLLFINPTNNLVGIGTTSPGAPLDVQRTSATSIINPLAIFRSAGAGTSSGSIRTQNSAGNHFNFGITAAGDFGLGYNANIGLAGDLMRMTPAGNVGIGTTTPANRLDVEGGAAIGAAYSGSTAAPANGLIVEGNVGIGTNAPAARLHASSSDVSMRGETSGATGRGVFGTSTSTTGLNYGVYGQSDSTDGRGVFGIATASTGLVYGGRFESLSTAGIGVGALASTTTGANIGVFGQSNSTSGTGVYGRTTATSGFTFGVFGENASPSGRSVYGLATSASGNSAGPYAGIFINLASGGAGVGAFCESTTGINWGVSATNASTQGMALFGRATALSGETYGVFGRSDSATGYGVFGSATSPTGINFGGWFETESNEGRAVFGTALATAGSNYGGRFQSASNAGRGVLGMATATSGDNYGVQGQAASTTGIGVFGVATSSSGLNYGVYGRSTSTAGVGVYGETTSTTSSNIAVYGRNVSAVGYGVLGRNAASSGARYGVYGDCTASGGGVAVHANGNSTTSGTKSFRIDHPDDPANKYLLHYSIESPEVLNTYSGKVTLNGAGEAIVELPLYFARINRDPRYTLTAIGASMPNLHIADEIDENTLIDGNAAEPGALVMPCWFRIAGGTPGMKVSWEVKAVRNDAYVRQYGAPVEVAKQDHERGTYQHPQLYGKPASAALGHMPDVSHTKHAVEDAMPRPLMQGADGPVVGQMARPVQVMSER